MGSLLSIAKGVDALTTSQIPDKWDKDWFSSFFNTWLGRGDIRNATTDGNITINGTSSGYAYISLNSTGSPALTPAFFSAGISITGGTLTINNGITGTQTATFSATNKPGPTAATSPATWIPVTISGVQYVIPAFVM